MAEPIDRTRFLDEARSLGDQFVDTAIRWRDGVNWITRTIPEKIGRRPSDKNPQARRMGSSLYNGVVGPAIFLAHLYRATGDARHRDTARGAMAEAIRLALADLQGGRQAGRLGFYSGHIGVLWAAYDLWDGLEDPFLLDRAKVLKQELLATPPAPGEVKDLMAGHAGAIPALLAIARTDPDEVVEQYARTMADQLVQSAQWTGDACAWDRPEMDWKAPLTGFSHGAAGYGHGLLEMYRHTGDEAYLAAARGAFRYEASCYYPEERNWPDLRWEPNPDGKHGCASIWCHGAGGIGLGRAHAHQVLQDPALREDLHIALGTTRARLARAIMAPNQLNGYCHGMPSNVELVMAMEEATGREGAVDRARRAAAITIERFGHEARARWSTPFVDHPFGYPGYTELSMMVGLAGTGYHMLRMYEPKGVPTLLVPGTTWRRQGRN